MRQRTKKQKRLLNDIINLILLIAAFGGWYYSQTLKGAIISFAIAIAIILLFSIWRSHVFNQRMKESGIEMIDQMTGVQFEEYVSVLFKNQGYSVQATPITGDYGADVILKKNKETIVVQAKRYKNNVGVKAVQEIIPAMKMYHATEAWVITNSYYTQQALTLAKRNKVRMINRDELIRMSVEMKRK